MISVVIPVVLLILCFRLISKSNRKIKDIDRYEFENRTDGGVVKFKTYDDAISNRKNKAGANVISAISMMAGLVLFIWLLVSLIGVLFVKMPASCWFFCT